MTAGRAIEPVPAVPALGLGKSLLLLTLGALSVHFAPLDVVGEEQAAAGAFSGIAFADLGSAVRVGADKDGFAAAAPVLPFFLFLADRTFIHGQPRHSPGAFGGNRIGA